jgi:hypoxanthine phosphoribosyltransferase
MTAAVQFMESLRPKVLKTATLSYSTESIVRPDFFVSSVSENDWLLYPWNYFEDFEELIAKAKKKIKQKDASPEIISKAITDNFGVTLPLDDLKYVLEEIKEPHGAKRSKQ